MIEAMFYCILLLLILEDINYWTTHLMQCEEVLEEVRRTS